MEFGYIIITYENIKEQILMNKGIRLGLEVESSNSKNSSGFGSFLKNTKKFIAFTLAETLIVMGIIGVVAALTIPNLNSSTNNMEKVTKVKKIYAELNEAHNRATAVYGPLETWFVNDICNVGSDCKDVQERYYNRLTEFMKLQKDCGTTSTGCMPTSVKNLYGGNYPHILDDTSCPRAILSGGWSLNVIQMYKEYGGSAYKGYNINKSAGLIFVDIDGPNKGKNIFGVDIFGFVVTSDGIYPDGGGSDWNDSSIKSGCFYYGYFCTAWIINTGNMDYLNTVTATTASNGGVCKNDSTKKLSTTVTSCK